MKRTPRKLYRFIITDITTGAQEIINDCLFSYFDGEAVEIHTSGGDVLTYNSAAVNVKRV